MAANYWQWTARVIAGTLLLAQLWFTLTGLYDVEILLVFMFWPLIIIQIVLGILLINSGGAKIQRLIKGRDEVVASEKAKYLEWIWKFVTFSILLNLMLCFIDDFFDYFFLPKTGFQSCIYEANHLGCEIRGFFNGLPRDTIFSFWDIYFFGGYGVFLLLWWLFREKLQRFQRETIFKINVLVLMVCACLIFVSSIETNKLPSLYEYSRPLVFFACNLVFAYFFFKKSLRVTSGQ